ncbi:type III secretion system export apparatus subunit SctT [Tanticharoenia sakaeratensis]|uniref:RhcT protein n=1 Tax=Tanticharoenia sakaeratensis NBRC 103193 TaxID=1231623 RepID=A0A0D6MNM1_9PROT|nr:type III secretion system export apparatus subunit SctT [Tanticharoenia sakaeratensis]GAN55015.1 RhcT protein [Tanticharoenia sakaeratensis NBRC 103193]GBQ24536.1 type III secretion component EscT [Tanticharoenia sakaeratensis NBRC 103193]
MPPLSSDAAGAATALFPALTALAIAMGRPMGVALVLPIFTRAQIGGPIRGAFAFVLALPVAPAIYRGIADSAPVTPMLAILGAKELVIGVMIGLLAGLPIWGIQSVGEVLDTHRSATQGQVSEPGSGNQDSLTATLLAMTAIALFVTGGGLGLIAQTIAQSEEVWPPLSMTLHPKAGFGTALLGLLDRIEIVSLTVAAPVTLAMLLCDACVILLMRAIPKLHLYDLAPTLRNLAFTLMMLAYTAWLVVYARREMITDGHLMNGLKGLLSP